MESKFFFYNAEAKKGREEGEMRRACPKCHNWTEKPRCPACGLLVETPKL
jgi:hypothetical protein